MTARKSLQHLSDLLDMRGSPSTGLVGLSSIAVPSVCFWYSFPMMEVQMMVRVLGKLGEESFNIKEEMVVARPEPVQDTDDEFARI